MRGWPRHPSPTEPVHFLQIWILPSQEDVPPSYQHVACSASEKRGVLRLIAGPDKDTHPPAVFIHQDAHVYASVLALRISPLAPVHDHEPSV